MDELKALTERVRILEQRSRRLRNVGIVLALSVIASIAFSQQRQGTALQPQNISEVIEAKKFVLKDDHGIERAVLGSDSRGSMFSLYGPDSNTQSFPVVSLTTSMNNGVSKGYLMVNDVAAEDIRSFHGAITAPKFLVKDDTDKTRAILGSSELRTIKTGAVTTRPPSSLVLLDKEGKVLWSAP